MKLGDKIRYLREVEGTLRFMGREMTQQEIVRAIKRELKQSISQSYLSQIESGSRPHLTNSTRMLLARFFKVHPSYLVDDPEGFHTELMSDVRVGEDQLDLWLIGGVERFARDPEVSRARRAASARSEDGRPIDRGVEVVVTRYERGIAYVRPWEELSESKKEN
jgi:transcriptional regulator with XRE-family HTH domain